VLTKNCHLRIVQEMWHNGNTAEKNRNYRHSLHCVNIFPPRPLVLQPYFFCSKIISRTRIPFLLFGDLTLRIRYSIGRAVVDLIEHKGFRYSSNAICNRATYPIKSSYAVGCTPMRRQTLDKFIRCFFILALWFLFALSCAHLEFNIALRIFYKRTFYSIFYFYLR